MKKIILFVALLLLFKVCLQSKPIPFDSYYALKCGLNRRNDSMNKFIFNKNTGSLFYFDTITETFKPITKRIQDGIYFNAMEEFYSNIEGNIFVGKKLVVRKIEYPEDEAQLSIIKMSINMRWLVMDTLYKNFDGKKVSRKEKCIWIEPTVS